MPRKIRVNAGQKAVSLPNGRIYDGPVEVVLTDDEFGDVKPSLFPTVLTDLGAVDGGVTGVLPVGLYVQASPDANGAQAATLNRELCLPVMNFDSGRLDRLAVRVGGQGTEASVIRLGLRSNDAGKPGAVVVEGTVDATTIGWKELVLDTPIAPGLLWLSLVGQGWTTTAPTFQTAFAPGLPFSVGSARAALDWAIGHSPALSFQENVTGTLAAHATFPAGSSNNLSIPLFALRRSA